MVRVRGRDSRVTYENSIRFLGLTVVSCHSFLVPFPFRSLRSVTLHLLPSRRNEVTSDVRDGEEVSKTREAR